MGRRTASTQFLQSLDVKTVFLEHEEEDGLQLQGQWHLHITDHQEWDDRQKQGEAVFDENDL
tara:strand:- start:242 stop:427 length:186 start_codon:yes stop_codon:yes gene_type:complete